MVHPSGTRLCSTWDDNGTRCVIVCIGGRHPGDHQFMDPELMYLNALDQWSGDRTLLREVVPALEWLRAIAEEYYMVSGFAPELGYQRREFDDATHGLRAAMKHTDTVLGDPHVAKFRKKEEGG